jgi:hypothetical protein
MIAQGADRNIPDYRLIDEAQIKLWQMKSSFARQELASDGALKFVDRIPSLLALQTGLRYRRHFERRWRTTNVGVFGGAWHASDRNTND